MAAQTPQRTPRRRWTIGEKRRIVELTLRKGASVRAIAREQGVNRNSLYQWQALYRAGKFRAPSAPRVGTTPGATFLPVTITAERSSRSSSACPANARSVNVVQLLLPSGAALRIATDALDVRLICALISELRQ